MLDRATGWVYAACRDEQEDHPLGQLKDRQRRKSVAMRDKDKLFGIGIVLCSLIAVKTEGQEKNHRPPQWDQFCVFPVHRPQEAKDFYKFEVSGFAKSLSCQNLNKCWNTVIAELGQRGYELVSTHLDRGIIIATCFKKEKYN